MSDLGHIRGDAPQTRAKSRGAEACHCTEIIHVLITLPVCLRMSSAEPLLSLRLSALWSNLCPTQYESLIARRSAKAHISKGTLLSLSAEPIRHHPAHAYMSTSVLELWSLHILCLRQKQELCCLIICSLKPDWFAPWTSALLIHFKTAAHKSQIKMPAAIFLSPNNDVWTS